MPSAIDYQSIFIKLKPICDMLARNTLPEKIAIGLTALEEFVSREELAQFADYIAFPLIPILTSEKTSPKSVESVFRIFERLLKNSNGHISTRIYVELFNAISFRLTPKFEVLDEFVLVSALHVLTLLLSTTQLKEYKKETKMFNMITSVQVVSQKRMFPLFASPILHILQIAKTHQSTSVKQQCINLVIRLTELIENSDSLSQVLPGIVSAVLKIVLEKENMNSSVIISSLLLLQTIITFVFIDYPTCKSVTTVSTSQNLSSPRTHDWLQQTLPRLNSAISRLIILRTHSSSKVHNAFIEFSNALLSLEALTTLNLPLIEILLYYQTSPLSDISNISQNSLKSISIVKSQHGFLVESLAQKMNALPNAVKSDNVSYIDLVNGYVLYLESEASFTAHSRLSDFIKSADVLEMGVVETAQGCLKYAFRYGDEAIKSLSTFWKLCGSFMNMTSIFTLLLEMLDGEWTAEVVWTLNQIITGCASSATIDSDTLLSVSNALLRILESMGRNVVRKRVTSLCMCLDAIVSLSKSLALEYTDFLEQGLLNVLQLVGDDNILISQSASNTLKKTSIYLNYKNEKEMIIENFDYIISAVGVRLESIQENPKIAQVLCAIAGIAGESCVLYVEDIVENLLDVLDTQQGNAEICVSVAKALAAFVSIGECEIPSVSPLAQNEEDGVNGEMLEFKRRIKEYKNNELEEQAFTSAKNIEEIEEYFKEKANETDQNQNQDETAEDERLTPNQHLTISILSRMQYLLTSDTPQIRTITLGLITTAIKTLAGVSKILYPYIHEIWPELIRRLEDKEFYVIIQSLKLVSELAKYAGDFLTRRAMDDIWPIVNRLAEKLKKFTLVNTRGTLFIHSVEFKVQRMYIKTIASLLNYVPLRCKDIQLIPKLLWVFMDSVKYPSEIQNLALDCIQTASRKNGDVTWLLKQVSSGRMTIQSPDLSLLPDLKIPSHMQDPSILNIGDNPSSCIPQRSGFAMPSKEPTFGQHTFSFTVDTHSAVSVMPLTINAFKVADNGSLMAEHVFETTVSLNLLDIGYSKNPTAIQAPTDSGFIILHASMEDMEDILKGLDISSVTTCFLGLNAPLRKKGDSFKFRVQFIETDETFGEKSTSAFSVSDFSTWESLTLNNIHTQGSSVYDNHLIISLIDNNTKESLMDFNIPLNKHHFLLNQQVPLLLKSVQNKKTLYEVYMLLELQESTYINTAVLRNYYSDQLDVFELIVRRLAMKAECGVRDILYSVQIFTSDSSAIDCRKNSRQSKSITTNPNRANIAFHELTFDSRSGVILDNSTIHSPSMFPFFIVKDAFNKQYFRIKSGQGDVVDVNQNIVLYYPKNQSLNCAYLEMEFYEYDSQIFQTLEQLGSFKYALYSAISGDFWQRLELECSDVVVHSLNINTNNLEFFTTEKTHINTAEEEISTRFNADTSSKHPSLHDDKSINQVSYQNEKHDIVHKFKEQFLSPNLQNDVMAERLIQELDSRTDALKKIGSDLYELREKNNELELEMRSMKARIREYEHRETIYLDTTGIDHLSLTELQRRCLILSEKLRTEEKQNKLLSQRTEELHTITFERNEFERKLLEMSQAHTSQALYLQKLQERAQETGKYRKVISKQEDVIAKLESLLNDRFNSSGVSLPTMIPKLSSDDQSTINQFDSEIFMLLSNENKQLMSKVSMLEAQMGNRPTGQSDDQLKITLNELKIAQAKILEFELNAQILPSQMEDECLELIYRAEAAELRAKVVEEELIDYTRSFAAQLASYKNKVLETENKRIFMERSPFSSYASPLDPYNLMSASDAPMKKF